MPIIIDGWNLIRSGESDIDDIEEESIESAKKLISYLKTFQETHKDAITVVFDSSREYLDLNHDNNTALSVVPARNADEYIKKYVDEIPERQRRNLRVVSSDNDIYYYAKKSYAAPIKSEEFWHKLKFKPNRHNKLKP
ncbi:MAG: hypothetical protein A2987_03165 [Omnitrophica bacterium RIFCSPLOWO2_01_FULL_45_10]|nr:MAG: hypothetical protein A2987_03165 [Omnitrophica bacterium RIFCSPLOWO2_01_FULL_45_10]